MPTANWLSRRCSLSRDTAHSALVTGHLELQLGRLSRYLGALAARLDAGLEAVPGMTGLGALESRRLAMAADTLGEATASQPVETPPAMSPGISPRGVHDLVVAIDDAVTEALAAGKMPIFALSADQLRSMGSTSSATRTWRASGRARTRG